MNLIRQKIFLLLALTLANGFFARAQATGNASAPNFSAFQIINDRNIFDPDRYPRTGRTRSRPRIRASAPEFTFVGTMNYQKGLFAFFDGNSSDYRKVLQRNGVIAGYTVTEITPTGVKLQAAGKKPIEMKVGAQMRQDGENGWELSDGSSAELITSEPETAATADSDETKSNTDDRTGNSGVEPNDILKKLMQQREQELK
jgi:hypothetical protein